EPVKLSVETQSPGIQAHVLLNHLRAAEGQLAAARAALGKAKADLAAKDDDSRRALVAAAAKAVLVAEAAPGAITARAAAERARIGKTPDAADHAKAAAAAEKALAVLQADEALARAEAELVTAVPAKRPEAEKKRTGAAAVLAGAQKALESPGNAYTP